MISYSASETEWSKRVFTTLSQLYPLHRSLISEGSRQTLRLLLSGIDHRILKYPSGLEVGDWKVPLEWIMVEGKLSYRGGDLILNASDRILSILQYSDCFEGVVDYGELSEHIFTDPQKPGSVPYRTSYYVRNWGFCMSSEEFEALERKEFEVKIDTKFVYSHLEIGEVFLKGKSTKEIVFTSYTCHPNMINNELVGPVLLRELMSHIASIENRHFSYRFLLMPETIGAICYLSDHLSEMQTNVLAGYTVTCFGDDRSWGMVHGPDKWDKSSKVAGRVFEKLGYETVHYSFLERGSDERQFCSPNADLPFTTLVRSKFGEFPEYHTSGDDFSMITEASLRQSFGFLQELVMEFEASYIFRSISLGEPFFTKFNLREKVGGGVLSENSKQISHIVAYSDGCRDTKEIASILQIDAEECLNFCFFLEEHGILQRV